MEFICILLALFGIKHFICDFVLQNENMLKDKGVYIAPGGCKHAAIHTLGTLIVLLLIFPWDIGAHIFAIIISLLDGVIHYHIDWAKTNLNRGLTPADRKFWVWFGADQGLHYLTYVGIIAILVT
jgi:hypothetical protein